MFGEPGTPCILNGTTNVEGQLLNDGAPNAQRRFIHIEQWMDEERSDRREAGNWVPVLSRRLSIECSSCASVRLAASPLGAGSERTGLADLNPVHPPKAECSCASVRLAASLLFTRRSGMQLRKRPPGGEPPGQE